MSNSTYFGVPPQPTNRQIADELEAVKEKEEALENREEALERAKENEETSRLFTVGLEIGANKAESKERQKKAVKDELRKEQELKKEAEIKKETQSDMEDKNQEDEHVKEAA